MIVIEQNLELGLCDASSIANVQLPNMLVSLIFSVASCFVVCKWKSKTHYHRNHRYYYRVFCPFHVSFNRSFDSCSSCLDSHWHSINADRFCEYRVDFDSKAIQWDIIGDESFNFPYWILSGARDCKNIFASRPSICRIRYRWYFILVPISRLV